jgi:transposase-like protein
MFEKNMHKEDVEIDKKLAKHPPSARSREFTPVEVTCRVCGKTEEVNPSLIYDAPNRYKCNKCSRTPG